jgi:hypothetical protein
MAATSDLPARTPQIVLAAAAAALEPKAVSVVQPVTRVGRGRRRPAPTVAAEGVVTTPVVEEVATPAAREAAEEPAVGLMAVAVAAVN